MKINTKELSGRALDWAVGQALGAEVKDHAFGIEGSPVFRNCTVLPDGRAFTAFRPSSDWSQGGPLIEHYIGSIRNLPGDAWEAKVLVSRTEGASGRGCNPLIASMRALVHSDLGDEVDVPDDQM